VSGAINSASVEGFLAANGVGLNFNDNCAVENASLTSVDGVFIYINYVETFVQFTNALCYSTSRGKLNHIEVKLSTTSIEVWASDYSPDNVAFPNFRKIGSAAISIPFSSGYVHFQQKERAPIKNEAGFYNPGYANNYWSNLGFDGPVIAGEVAYQVPDALTVDPNSATNTDAHIAGAVNVGYGLLTSPYGMYSCCTSGSTRTSISTLSIPDVSLTGVTSAQLTFTVTYTYTASLSPTTVNLRYSLNGGPWLNPNPQPNYLAELVCNACCALGRRHNLVTVEFWNRLCGLASWSVSGMSFFRGRGLERFFCGATWGNQADEAVRSICRGTLHRVAFVLRVADPPATH
jgi:hypothetical protein